MNKCQTLNPFCLRALRWPLVLALLATASVSAQPPKAAALPAPAIATLRVTETGIQRVRVSDLAANGVDLTGIRSDSLALFHNGQAVPVHAVADADAPPAPADRVFHGNFDPAPAMTGNGYLEFLGFSQDSLYQHGQVYELRLAAGTIVPEDTRLPTASMNVPAYYWQQITQAPDAAYSFASPIEDPWYAKRLLATSQPVSERLSLVVSRPFTAGPAASLKVRLWGGTDYPQQPDHHVQLAVDGQLRADLLFDGITEQLIETTLPADQLSEGQLALDIVLPKDLPTAADLVHVESWQLLYPRQPVLMNGGLQLATDQAAVLLKGARATDYAIYRLTDTGRIERISQFQLQGPCTAQPADECQLHFIANGTTAAQTARYFVQETTALHLPVLDVPPLPEDIVSGKADYLVITHPDFIGPDLQTLVDYRSQQQNVKVVDLRQVYGWFSHHNVDAQAIADYIAFAVSTMGTRNVLLVGGDTYDYQDKLGHGAISFVPTLYAQTDALIHFAPVDAKLADVDNDNVPDVALGRLLVRNESELQAIVAKILAYENKTYGQTAVFAADQYDSGQGYSFKQDAQALITSLPPDWQANIGPAQQAFVDDDGVAGAKAKITAAIQNGVALTSFVGHSGPKDWTYSGLFKASDAQALTNADAPTLVTQWGCWNTYFVSPEEDTMAHAFMLNSNGGAAAVLGASTLTRADAERGLAQRVLQNLTTHGMSLGEAVLQAKRDWAVDHPEDLDVILGWNILGDPATRL